MRHSILEDMLNPLLWVITECEIKTIGIARRKNIENETGCPSVKLELPTVILAVKKLEYIMKSIKFSKSNLLRYLYHTNKAEKLKTMTNLRGTDVGTTG